MPDFGAPVAAGVNPVGQGLQTVSSLMGIRQQQQALQSGALGIQQQQAQLPAIQAEAQTAQMKQSQIQNFSNLVQSKVDDQGNSLVDPTTNDLDVGKVMAMQGRVAPLAPELAGNIAKTHGDLIGMKAASLSLTGQQRATMAGVIQGAGLSNDPKMIQAANDQVDALVQQNPQLAPYLGPVKNYISQLSQTKDPQQRVGLASKMSQMFLPPQGVNTQAGTTPMDLGGQIQPGVTAPAAAGGGFTPTGAPIDKNIAPGQQDTLERDSQGSVFLVHRNPNGSISRTLQPPGANASGGGGIGAANLPANVTPEQRNSLAQEVSSQSTQASQAGSIHAINQEIYQLAGKASTTNLYGQVGSKLRQTIGVDPLPGNDADDYDSMTKMLAQSNMRAAQAMGVHTDAQSAQVAQASGSQHYAPTALKNVVSVNDGMTKAQQMYAAGLANAIDTKGYGAANAFKTQWGNAFNLDAAQYMAAKDSGDPVRLKETKTKLGLNDPAKAAALADKIKQMHDLSGTP